MFLSPCDDSPPYSSYPNPILYEKGFGYFLFIEVYRSNRTVNEQRQGITMMVVPCLLIVIASSRLSIPKFVLCYKIYLQLIDILGRCGKIKWEKVLGF